jgi:hypothetical protein
VYNEDKRWAVVTLGIQVFVKLNVGNFWNIWATISFSSIILIHTDISELYIHILSYFLYVFLCS